MSEKSKHIDPYHRVDPKEKRLLLNGTTLSVKSKAQVFLKCSLCSDRKINIIIIVVFRA